MKILVLNSIDSPSESVCNYAADLGRKTDAEIHLLNIVQVSGDIPTKYNGEVLDNCTEFDLSPYLKERDEHLDQLGDYLTDYSKVIKCVKVGDAQQIIKTYVEDNDVDLVISGSHVTGPVEDFFTSTFSEHTEETMEGLNVPYVKVRFDPEDGIVVGVESHKTR